MDTIVINMVAPLNTEWSECISDEMARQRGYVLNRNNPREPIPRNRAMIDDCKRRGYPAYNEGWWKDCGGWKFAIRCLAPTFNEGWVDMGPDPNRFGVVVWATKINPNGMEWNQAGQYILDNHIGPYFNGRRVVDKQLDNRGAWGQMWIKIFLEDQTLWPTWDPKNYTSAYCTTENNIKYKVYKYKLDCSKWNADKCHDQILKLVNDYLRPRQYKLFNNDSVSSIKLEGGFFGFGPKDLYIYTISDDCRK